MGEIDKETYYCCQDKHSTQLCPFAAAVYFQHKAHSAGLQWQRAHNKYGQEESIGIQTARRHIYETSVADFRI